MFRLFMAARYQRVNSKSSPNSIWDSIAAIALELRRGDQSALTRLYDVAGARLLRYSEALTKNRADAEDVLQTSLVRVARQPRGFLDADKPWAYLVAVVRNESLKLVKQRRLKFSFQNFLAAWRAPECPIEQAESREQVQAALQKLPPEQAEVVVLKIWEEFTFAEIASLIGESPNTAASRYRYALEKLSRTLQPMAEEVRHV